MSIYLDFEKPIEELEQKISELRDFSSKHDVDVVQSIEILQKRLDETRKVIFGNLTSWQRVQLARHPQRPFPTDYIERLFTDFLELHGDRCFADDRAIIGGFAKFDGNPVMVIASQKGREVKENMEVNFGMGHPEGYRKALRLMRLADSAGIPIICLVDTPGAYPGIAAEERHIGEAIAVNLMEMFRFGVPMVAAVMGEGGSGGALGIAVGNRVLIMQNAYYSVITPEGCAAILWRDASAAPEAAESLKLTGSDLIELELVDEVVPEPPGGAHRDWDEAADIFGEVLQRNLDELKGLSPDELRTGRYEKFRAMGVFKGE